MHNSIQLDKPKYRQLNTINTS